MEHARITQTPEELPIERILRPFQKFARLEASGGILLLLCAVAALVWANSTWAESYEKLWDVHFSFGAGSFSIDEPLHFWINDAIMAIFFFVVGLEIKRAILVGELASPRRAALPVVAALGGMIAPALIYIALNAGTDGSQGWGVPMATDIAFSLGVLALLGNRVPLSLKMFLTAFAIVDDLGAVVVIAVFFTEDISWVNLAVGSGFLVTMVAANRIGIGHALVYLLLGIAVWLAFLASGIHATVAGVMAAATIPSRVRINADQFLTRGRALLDKFQQERSDEGHEGKGQTTMGQSATVQELEAACMDVESPLQQIEHDLHPWVAFAIMPLFALANAGVHLDADIVQTLVEPVTLGVIIGLVVGKPLGIISFAWIAVRTGLAAMPYGITWRHLYGVAWLGGIGFTMSIFISGLAFVDASLISEAKIGILVGSLVSGLGGWLVLRGAKTSGGYEAGNQLPESPD